MGAFGNCFKANDECYTTELQAEYVVSKYYDWLKGKRIILPCDQEGSELYKACKRYNLDCDIAQDMGGVDYSNYDIVFTNPPFHGIAKWIKFLEANNVKYLIFAPGAIILGCIKKWIKGYYLEHHSGGKTMVAFKKSDDSFYSVHGALISNLEEGKAIVESKPDVRIEPTDDGQGYKGIWSDLINCNYLKYDGDYKSNRRPTLMIRRKYERD